MKLIVTPDNVKGFLDTPLRFYVEKTGEECSGFFIRKCGYSGEGGYYFIMNSVHMGWKANIESGVALSLENSVLGQEVLKELERYSAWHVDSIFLGTEYYDYENFTWSFSVDNIAIYVEAEHPVRLLKGKYKLQKRK